jgi:hypothetical protein
VTPGTYYWQADRVCVGCPSSDYEVLGVRSLTVRAPIEPALHVQAKAFSGYPVIVALDAAGVPEGAKIAVEMARGAGWRELARAGVLAGKAEAVVVLPRGRQRLRVHSTIGDQESVSEPRTITVAAARGWKTSARDDGSYTDRAHGNRLSLNVARRGRRVPQLPDPRADAVRRSHARPEPLHHRLAPVKKAKVAPDGRFYAS